VIGDTRQDLAQVRFRIESVEFRRADQTVDGGRALAARVGAGEGKLVFDKTPPATIDRYNRSKLFLAWDGDRFDFAILPFVLLVRTLSARDQQHHAGTRGLPPTEGHSWGGLDSADED